MTEDFEGLDEDLAQSRALVQPIPPEEFIADLERMLPLVQALVAGWSAGRVHMADPNDRAALVALRAAIVAVKDVLWSAQSVIERAFLDDAIARGATTTKLPDGRSVIYEPPRGEYVGDMRALRTALATIANLDGTVTMEEVDMALKEEVVVKPDHRRINAIAKRAGGSVAEAIAKHRQHVVPSGVQGKVRFPR